MVGVFQSPAQFGNTLHDGIVPDDDLGPYRIHYVFLGQEATGMENELA
jgi:hypothetical protein